MSFFLCSICYRVCQLKAFQGHGQRVAHKGSDEIFNYAELTVCYLL